MCDGWCLDRSAGKCMGSYVCVSVILVRVLCLRASRNDQFYGYSPKVLLFNRLGEQRKYGHSYK